MSEPDTARFDGIATIAQIQLPGMVTLRADLSDRKTATALKAVTGTAIPDALRVNWSGETGAAWMSPDELLLFVPDAPGAVATLDTRLKGQHATAVDVSDARAAFRITGALAREVLAKLTPADMAPAAFAEGSFRRTRLAQVPVAIWAGQGGFGLVCFRSVAPYVFDLLCGAAAPGSAVGYFPDGA